MTEPQWQLIVSCRFNKASSFIFFISAEGFIVMNLKGGASDDGIFICIHR